MHHPLTPYIPVCDAIATLFSPHVEAILHDLDSGLIFHMSNAFSKRRAGDSSLNEPGLAGTLDADVIGPYAKSNWDGRRLKSITAVLRDGGGKAIGLLCINHDIEAFSGLFDQLQAMMTVGAAPAETGGLMAADWRESINTVIGDHLAARHVTLAGLTTGDIDAILAGLDERGIFAVRNAVPYVADILKLSRATIYNRLRALRGKVPAAPEGDHP